MKEASSNNYGNGFHQMRMGVNQSRCNLGVLCHSDHGKGVPRRP
uniref:Uncharacterized protein n=1 Tax=Magnetospirillum gryphiswaldense TaxID=55518 RepID=A4U1D7_9PROT|nr:hypothetical protein MGR_3046 [Magnetospirillum gryphiswaldense MSR-1]